MSNNVVATVEVEEFEETEDFGKNDYVLVERLFWT